MDDEQAELNRYAAANRARIEVLERELDRVRTRHHELTTSVAGLALALAPLRELPEAVSGLRDSLDRLGRRTVERPTAPGIVAVAAVISAVVAIIAMILTLLH